MSETCELKKLVLKKCFYFPENLSRIFRKFATFKFENEREHH